MTSTQRIVGSVVSLWRHPVKSMMGEELNASEVTKGGLLGDRAYALTDTSDGKVASAKNPRKWPQLFDFRAALNDSPNTSASAPPVRITLPEGIVVTRDHPDVNQILSNALKRYVTLDSIAPSLLTATAEEYWPDIGGLDPRVGECLLQRGSGGFRHGAHHPHGVRRPSGTAPRYPCINARR